MALRLGALHDAFAATGIDPALAQKAAEEVANYEQQMATLRSDMAVIKWMLGTVIALNLGILTVLLRFLGR
jgi:phage shock protein A